LTSIILSYFHDTGSQVAPTYLGQTINGGLI